VTMAQFAAMLSTISSSVFDLIPLAFLFFAVRVTLRRRRGGPGGGSSGGGGGHAAYAQRERDGWSVRCPTCGPLSGPTLPNLGLANRRAADHRETRGD
jgi:hypothetical protein